MSLVICFALDLPKLSTREPPPCIWDMNNSSRITINATGSSITSMLVQTLSCVTSVSTVPVIRPSCWAVCTWSQSWAPMLAM